VTVVGIDVGASKIAAACVDVTSGEVQNEVRAATPVTGGGQAILDACVDLFAQAAPVKTDALGIGLCEFVDLSGQPTSAYTVDWLNLDVQGAFGSGLPVRIESDVRAGALAEARFGAGRSFASFIYVVVGSGVSHSLVLDGRPYRGARGNAIVTGAPPLEFSIGGLALARRAGVASAEQVLADPAHAALVEAAAEELGNALAALVNALDPDAIVIGGGLGLVDGYRARVVAAARASIEHQITRELPMIPAGLGSRSGVVGAALAAIE
jgi:glucokinase